MRGTSQRQRRAWDAAFALCVLIVGAGRFIILRRGGAPPTIDAGNWLALGDAILGDSPRSSTLVYPPLVPLLTRASVGALGLTNGVAAMAAAAAVVPGVGVYVALRLCGLAAAALAPALLVLGASSVGEAAAWGGFPQLIGIGLTVVVLALFDRLLRSWRARPSLAAGLALMAVLATSHFLGLVAVLGVITMLALELVRPAGGVPRRRISLVGLVLLPSAWLLPLYRSMAQVYLEGSSIDLTSQQLHWGSLLGGIEFLYRDTPLLWRFAVPIALLAPLVTRRIHRHPLWRITTALLMATLLAAVTTRIDRFLYLLTPLTALGLALWIVGIEASLQHDWLGRDAAMRRRAAATFAVVIVMIGGFQLVRGPAFFQEQREFYGILTPGLVSGIRHVGETSSEDAVIAVTSLNNAPLGWWVEAIAKRPTLYGSPLRWLSFEDEIRRASFANALFAPPFPTQEKLRLADTAGVEVILLPTAWVFFDQAAVDELQREAPGGVIRVNGDLVVIRPKAFRP